MGSEMKLDDGMNRRTEIWSEERQGKLDSSNQSMKNTLFGEPDCGIRHLKHHLLRVEFW